ncbi:flagellar basal body protein FliL [Helicobacter sp. 16-1353]|uniref:flagellar basal body-associated protein FliL n=1 Tax=Helicobacter sp. 16-1353 TaxID=2004996 RepID=UPI000DCD8B79|nr:flagellar basal body-associated protein FliL [Helicobacter sp. 16-1353]RAX55259.1 flagellar basal body protein FliL [Helicobacter sp. 16-1353]
MAEEQKNKKSKVVLIIIIALIIIAILLGVAFYFMTKQNTTNTPETTPTSQDMSIGTDVTQTNANYIRIGPIYQLDQFIVNLLTQSGRRYLKTTIGLEMTMPELQNELNSKRAAIRDTIVEILSSKSLEEVSTTRGKEKLKEEIVQRLNEFLVDGKIRNVFFIDFVIQ